ncbi:spore germination protein [Pelotomaculum propionicicum]|uniref:spore germination protein n=1 Tax=Pelotomaculum propionicicum TaxID=258475 RepID=UPI003B7A78C6
MNILKNLHKMISYQENLDREGFILKETKDDKEAGPDKSGRPANPDNSGKSGDPDNGGKPPDKDRPQSKRICFKKPRRPSEMHKSEPSLKQDSVSSSLDQNMEAINRLYGLPKNKDIVLRDFYLGTSPSLKGMAVFIDGLTDKTLQDLLFQALMLFADRPAPDDRGKLAELVKEALLPGNQVKVIDGLKDVLSAVNTGDTVLFLEGCARAVLVETKGWEHRGVERPVAEQIILGPQEAFTETLRANTALLRKIIKNENLTTEFVVVGERSQTNVAFMYLRDLANPDLVKEVKRRIKSIKTDYVLDSGVIEQFIEDNPYSLNPTILATERPDRVASKVAEGRVAIIVDGSPFVLVVPTSMYEQLHTGEELYNRWQYGSFIRWLRALAFLLSFLLPGFYLAVVLYHQEMIPTELLLAIAGNRERVPFPSIVEVLLMEFSFELIREAGLRIPGVMGSTIGIVGALILGQAAVQANIVSPILVILVAVTGLASFAIPYYSLAFTMRIYRFFYIFLGTTLGFFGISMGLLAQVIVTANLKSFGSPYLAPAGPKTSDWADVVTVAPVFFHEKRPDYINPQETTRQPKVSRGWIKKNADEKAGDKND